MRVPLLILVTLVAALVLCRPATAGALDFLEDYAVGAGWNQGTENDALEFFVLSFKYRGNRWEYGLDACNVEKRGEEGGSNFGFAWAAWIEEFDRPDWQDYGIFVGAGAGVFFLEEDLIDWPGGPFLVLGWDFSPQAGLEGKVGYFGENYWGTALFYWYFE